MEAKHILCLILLVEFLFFQVNSDPVEDKQALLDFVNNLPHSRSLNWNESSPVCNNWTGVICSRDGARVIAVRLPGVGFHGPIPPNTLSRLSALQILSLRSNGISGEFPFDISNLKNLSFLYLQYNNLSGSLPVDFSLWPNLTIVNLSNNRFNGSIPYSFSNLSHLAALNLANNSLSGEVPDLNLPNLHQINLSNNNLSGSVPRSLRRFPNSVFSGNNIPFETFPPHASPVVTPSDTPYPRSRNKRGLGEKTLLGIIVASCVLGLLAFVFLIAVCCSRKKGEAQFPGKLLKGGMSPEKVVSRSQDANNRLTFFEGCNYAFDLEDLLRASAEVLGKGTFGMAYKAILEDATTVVVKRLKEVSVGKRDFEQQMEVVGSIRQVNVVELKAYYYSKDEKLMVYDYYSQGSISSMLHGKRGGERVPLDWDTRMRIAIGAARGIACIHAENGGKFVHGNIKSSNIFLNSQQYGCVSDLGLATITSPLAPPIARAAGYRAPEVADTRKAAQPSDVYSFGVVLLELLTGKSPIHTTGGDEIIHLVRWVHSVVREEWTAEVFDVELMRYPNIEEEMAFKSLNDVVLSPLSNPYGQNDAVSLQENSNAVGKKTTKKKRMAKRGSCLKKSGNSVAEKKRVGRRVIGMVNGSVSVVHQIRALVMHKCVKILARVLHVAESDGEVVEVRVVVLVDVYLPVSVWSGWQFPKSGPIAGSLFRHLSCDWEKRRSMLVDGGEYFKNALGDHRSIWNLSGCHVLGCNLHCDVPDSSSKKRFELHEIFKGLPSTENKEQYYSSRVKPADNSLESGIWDLTGDILMSILSALGPKDLVRVAATCHHLRSLAVSIMPCMKLKLFPHQQAAVEWMLQRERNAQVLPHPLYTNLSTEDGFTFHVSTVSGEIITGVAPTVRDFHGGMFCDEPGLGKTITALSLILKTRGTVADPPDGVQITWCAHNGEQRCGYYEVDGRNFTPNNTPLAKRVMNQSARRGQLSLDKSTLMNDPGQQIEGFSNSCPVNGMESSPAPSSDQTARVIQLSRVKRNLLHDYDETPVFSNKKRRKHRSNAPIYVSEEQRHDRARRLNLITGHFRDFNETWVQCEACRKWRKLTSSVADTDAAWFCSMNTNPERQSCRDAEEAWDDSCSLTHVPGFHTKGTSGGEEQNVSFFISVLKEHYSMINSKTKKALTWLAKLSPERLSLMETIGLASPVIGTGSVSGGGDSRGFHKIFEAFGLVRRVEKGASKWCYPQKLENLAFDLAAFRIAICKPLDSVRLYLSRATLVVVPANLVDHWKTQIEKHVKPGQLRLCVWTNHKKPSAHSLAWDYDVVITTFSRLSAEWGPRKKSPLMQVHFLRVMLDEGHTLGSSLSLTNKLQMAMSLMASNRWLLTGTPTPNTPNSQLSHLQPMLKFLQEEAYGLNQKSWEAGVLRPFEAEMEEGRTRLLHLLHRCLISSRKTDLKTIPPCIKKVTFLNFTKDHARSYNELVVTVRRNILTADWNDPSHVESLLNPKQWKFRSALIRNVRLSCCVAGHIKVAEVGEDIQETMDILIEKGLDPISEEHALIKYYLQYGGNCLRCKEWCRLPFITPCRHLLCLDCVALNSEKCTFPGCGYSYEMQSPEVLTRPENPNPKWPVPKDLIELQPSYKQDDWDPDWQSTSSSKVAYLVQKLKALQEASRESSQSIYKDTQISVSSLVLQQDCFSVNKAALEKVIIFSQFLEHIHVIEQQLAFAGIKFAGMYSPMPQINKMKSLATFQHDSTCMALLMDGSAALGLDLSFVTHVFLMEPIWDRSMEEQVISRAHRMGATRPINVETLAMRGTIEEQMLEFLQDADGCRRVLKEESSKTDHAGARLHRSLHDFAESDYLAHLSFVHTGSRA